MRSKENSALHEIFVIKRDKRFDDELGEYILKTLNFGCVFNFKNISCPQDKQLAHLKFAISKIEERDKMVPTK